MLLLFGPISRNLQNYLPIHARPKSQADGTNWQDYYLNAAKETPMSPAILEGFLAGFNKEGIAGQKTFTCKHVTIFNERVTELQMVSQRLIARPFPSL
jgi:hypothetical protein